MSMLMPVRPGFKHVVLHAPELPVASFRKIDEEAGKLEGVHDLQAQSYGFNDPNLEFKRPEAYIRYIEPLECELAKQVEYDMDEQGEEIRTIAHESLAIFATDQEWLDQVNAERKKQQVNTVSYEVFEIILDKIEKEWFELVKRLPKPETPGPTEDSTCAICDDAEVENTNAIVFCDGCNLAVHQECYGVPYIPEGQWLCRKCQLSPEQPVSCVLCPNEGGAFKQTTSGEWAHLLCAMYIAETSVGNSIIQEPIEGIERIERARWKLTCSICNLGTGNGACIQCAKTQCYAAYHATCARKLKLLMPMKGAEGEKLQLTSYCSKHIPPEQAGAHLTALKAEHERERAGASDEDSDVEPVTPAGAAVIDTPKSKAARAYAKSYTLGAPLVPARIVNSVLHYIQKITVHKKTSFVQLVCRYWSLKREARRGAPLLKRLHLEPWSTGGADEKLSKEERKFKLDRLVELRKDLERIRLIADLTKKREVEKLHQAETVKDLAEILLYPHEAALRTIFEKIQARDYQDIFKNPVSKQLVPDYFDIIKHPMCWSQIDERLDHHEYWDADDLRKDIELVLDNALQYNKKDSPIFKLANRIKTQVGPTFEQLKLRSTSTTPGDLQPALSQLNLLFSREEIEKSNPFEMIVDPVESLFNYELGKYKPEPPKPKKPRPPKKQKRERPPRDYRAERARREERLRLRREEEAALAATRPQPEYLPRTRGEAARLAEAGIVDKATGNERPAVATKEDVMGDELPVAKRKRPRRDSGPVLTIPTAVAQPTAQELSVVDTVSKEESFKLFNDGWILSPTARRSSSGRNGTSIEPPTPTNAVTPTSRTTPNKSPGKSVKKGEPSKKGKSTAQMKGDGMAADVSTARSVTRDLATSELSELSDISDEEREEAEEIGEGRNVEEILEGEPVPPDTELEREAELLHDEGPESDAVRHLKIRPGQTLEGGTLVWAKMESYPFWPAVVYEPDTPGISKLVLNSRNKITRKEVGPLHLVQFYDKSSSWQWLEPSKLYLLGDDDNLDGTMLSGKANYQRFRNSRLKTECRAAWRRAKAEMEVEGEEDEEVGRAEVEGSNMESEKSGTEAGNQSFAPGISGQVQTGGSNRPDQQGARIPPEGQRYLGFNTRHQQIYHHNPNANALLNPNANYTPQPHQLYPNHIPQPQSHAQYNTNSNVFPYQMPISSIAMRSPLRSPLPHPHSPMHSPNPLQMHSHPHSPMHSPMHSPIPPQMQPHPHTPMQISSIHPHSYPHHQQIHQHSRPHPHPQMQIQAPLPNPSPSWGGTNFNLTQLAQAAVMDMEGQGQGQHVYGQHGHGHVRGHQFVLGQVHGLPTSTPTTTVHGGQQQGYPYARPHEQGRGQGQRQGQGQGQGQIAVPISSNTIPGYSYSHSQGVNPSHVQGPPHPHPHSHLHSQEQIQATMSQKENARVTRSGAVAMRTRMQLRPPEPGEEGRRIVMGGEAKDKAEGMGAG